MAVLPYTSPPTAEFSKNISDPMILLPVRISNLHDHNCLLSILGFLAWEDLNTFSSASKGCHRVRCHSSLDQTRCGKISLGNGVSNTKELMEKVRAEHWSDNFCGYRTHLRLSGLTHLSSNIDPITQDFIDTIAPLERVTSLDCSIRPYHCHNDGVSRRTSYHRGRRPWFLAPFEDYVENGFAQGLTVSLLVPNLRSIDMSNLPITLVGVAWLAENNPNLQVIRWNRSLIFPISASACSLLEAMQNLKEVYLDDARMIFCADLNETSLWEAFSQNNSRLERVSLQGARWCRNGEFSGFSQNYLMKFVRYTPNLRWFRSDLLAENMHALTEEHPNVVFC